MEQSKIYNLQPVDNYYRKAIEILSFIPPFSTLSPKEMNVYAILLKLNDKYSNLDEKTKSKIIFDYDTYYFIADSIKKSRSEGNIHVNEVYTHITRLRKKKLIIKAELGYDILNPIYIIPKLDVIGFRITENAASGTPT